MTSATASTLGIGLQEWAVACRALLAGDLLLTVRKGGIHERGGGLFALEHQRFVLMPTYLHQERARLASALAARWQPVDVNDPEPGRIHIAGWAEAVRIWKCHDLVTLSGLTGELPWSADELARRFAYRDQPWLYVVALRVQRLPTTQVIDDRPAYAGCRSWITLDSPIDLTGSLPVLDDAAFAARLDRIAGRLA